MKIFLKILLISFIIVMVAVAGGLFWEYEKYKEEIIFIDPLDGKTKIKMNENEKDFIRRALRPILSFVYREATLHNPAGDVLPDQIDDNIKKNIKDRTGL